MLPVEVVEVFKQLLLADDGARTMDEILEDAVLGGRQFDRDAVAADRLFQGVDRESESGERGVGGAFAAADKRFSAGDELAQIEGFRKIVVRAGIEQLH